MLRKRTFSKYIIATFNVTNISNSTQILGWNQDNTSVTYDLTQIKSIKIDDKIITPRTHYQFTSTGVKTVVYYLNSNFTTMQNMFRNCVTMNTVNFTNCNTNNVINMRALFHTCTSLTNIIVNNNWKTHNVQDFGYMFYNCTNLTSNIVEPFLVYFNTKKATTFDSMFNSCQKIQSLRFDKFPNFKTQNATNMKYMFSNMKALISYDYSGKYGSDNYGFKGIKLNDNNGNNMLDTSNVQNMEGIFSGCSNTDFTYLNLKWNYNNLRYCKWMFSGCANLYTLTMMGNIYSDIQSANCEQMFYDCPQYGNFYYNKNVSIYTSIIIPQLQALNWTCTGQ